MRSRRRSAVGWLVTCVLAGACEGKADLVAGPSAQSSHLQDAGSDAAKLDCTYEAQLTRRRLPPSFARIRSDCQLLLPKGGLPDPLNQWVVPPGVKTGADATVCDQDPRAVWVVPPRPQPTEEVNYCPEICDRAKDALTCELRTDPCRALDSPDASMPRCFFLSP
jgi:hypothetical protein